MPLNPRLLFAPGPLARTDVQTGDAKQAIPHLPADEDGRLPYQLAPTGAAKGQQSLSQEVVKQYQEIQKAKAAEREDAWREIPITAPANRAGERPLSSFHQCLLV